jgi:SET domain-containing protein
MNMPGKAKAPQDGLTYVARSGIHGRGLFARRRISRGTVIGYVEGKVTRRNGAYTLWLSEDEGIRVTCNLRFINHSRRPNARYYDDLSVVALRTIEAGEEITHDYTNGAGGSAF